VTTDAVLTSAGCKIAPILVTDISLLLRAPSTFNSVF
jgi:hypothetical protein